MDYVYYTITPGSAAAEIIADLDKRTRVITKAWGAFFSSPLVKPTIPSLPDDWGFQMHNHRLIGISVPTYGDARVWVADQIAKRDKKLLTNRRQIAAGANEPPDVPWRYDEESGGIVLARKTTKGKQIAEEMDKLKPELTGHDLTLALTDGKVSWVMCGHQRSCSMILFRSKPKDRMKAKLHELVGNVGRGIYTPMFNIVVGVPYGFFLPGAHGVGPRGDGKESLQSLNLFQRLKPQGMGEISQSLAVVLRHGIEARS